jgi:predicted Zn finger-like uncharacterized protein
MRLTCPNCDARYQVSDEAIPPAGRDVQCSNCGQTWFQHHPDNPPAETDSQSPDLGAGPDLRDPDEEVAPPPPPRAPETTARRELDPAVADILRQEAEAEFEARRQRQSQSLETQPDLGLEEADDHPATAQDSFDTDPEDELHDQRAEQARRRMARMRGEPDPTLAAPASAAAMSSRRELLPDIDEINSTLRSDQDRPPPGRPMRDDYADPAGPAKPRRGFKRGFALSLIVIGAGILVYAYAPQIAAKLPQADPYLSAYVAWLDQLRMGLDVQAQRFLTWLDSIAQQASS